MVRFTSPMRAIVDPSANSIVATWGSGDVLGRDDVGLSV